MEENTPNYRQENGRFHQRSPDRGYYADNHSSNHVLTDAIAALDHSNRRIEKAYTSAERWKTIRSVFFTLFFALPLLGIATLSYIKTATGNAADTKFVNVVSINGPILQGMPASADVVIPKLAKVFDDKNASGVIIKLSSPGGSPVQSDRIRQTIVRLTNKYPEKQVAVYGADMMTSGAYMIATAAPRIYANPSTVVGSVGVVAQSFDFTELMKKVGVKERVNTAGEMKSSMSPFSEVKPYQQERLDELLKGIHKNFKDIVIEARGAENVSEDDMNGTFWLAQEAIDKGFIDDIASIEEIAEMMGADGVNYHRSFSDMFPRGLGVMVQTIVNYLR